MPALNTAEMLEEYEQKKETQQRSMRRIVDFGRGLVFIAVGSLFLFHDKLPLPVTDRIPGTMVKVIGGLFILYGCWRIYQGYARSRQK